MSDRKNSISRAPGSRPPDPVHKSQLQWQCRRGMRELDVLLQRWLDRHFDAATEAQKSAFQALLALPDPELAAYVLRDGTPDQPDTAHVLQQIRAPFSP